MVHLACWSITKTPTLTYSTLFLPLLSDHSICILPLFSPFYLVFVEIDNHLVRVLFFEENKLKERRRVVSTVVKHDRKPNLKAISGVTFSRIYLAFSWNLWIPGARDMSIIISRKVIFLRGITVSGFWHFSLETPEHGENEESWIDCWRIKTRVKMSIKMEL